MKRTTIIKVASALLAWTLISVSQVSKGQQKEPELKKEVEVVKPYEPSVSDVLKINEMPRIKPQEAERPAFDYAIKPTPVFSTFQVEPVQAARMAGEPGPEQTNGLIRLGVGNYQSPYGRFSYHTGSGKKTTLGVDLNHFSSHGKIRLLNGDQVKAPSSDNHAELFLNQFFNNSAKLKATLFFDKQAFRYYGYAGEELDQENKTLLIPFWNKQQAFSRGGIDLQLTGKDQQGAGYEAGMTYQHYQSKTGQKGNLIRLGGQVNKNVDHFQGRLDAFLTIDGTDSVRHESTGTFIRREKAVLELSPSVLFETEMASLRLGISSYTITEAEKIEDFMVTPLVKASWSPVKNWLTLFAGAAGHLQQNHYLAIANENQFVNPDQHVKDTKYRYILSGGIRGKIANQWNYRFQADYSSIRDHHFYILTNRFTANPPGDDELTTRSNTFDVRYDNVKQLGVGGEIRFTASDMLNVLLGGTYYSRETKTQPEAWHQPDFESSASVSFTPSGPFRFTADLYYLGERKALVAAGLADAGIVQLEPLRDMIRTLDPILDMNFSITYQHTRQLSFRTQVNNFSAQKYERWLGYTSKGINFLLGLSYSF
ncbi:MAG: hypothetical protein PHI28_08820 [Mangrovibacterium sp.]|nr:hypothetical protein [Mangrovibacterium sp.]